LPRSRSPAGSRKRGRGDRARSTRPPKAAPAGDGQDLYAGLIRLHILHHAAEEPFYGLWLIEELAHHGYRLSPGTLYPLLHRLERQGYLKSTTVRDGRRGRRLYRATPSGRRALASAREKVRELFGEMFVE
jgi:DNA-binding PadR family transcriptional regulator